MNTKLRIAIIICIMCLLFAGCGSTPGNNSDSKANESKTNENQVRIHSIQFTLASENYTHVYSAKFPYYIYVLNPYSKRIELCDFAEKPNKIISRDDFNLFNDFINAHSKETKSSNSVFAYSIYLSFYDEEGDMQSSRCVGYDSFPEELNVLIDKYNELCGQYVFSYPDKVQKFSSDFIYDEFDLTEEDYPAEAIDEMIENSRLNFGRFVGNVGSIENYMKGYEHSLGEEKIKDIMPTELLPEVAVTDEEFDESVEIFLNNLGDGWEISDYSGQVNLIRVVNTETNEYMYIGKASALSAYTVRFDFGEGRIELDAHMEDMTVSTDFMYNKSGAYILVDFKRCEDFVEIANSFYEIE